MIWRRVYTGVWKQDYRRLVDISTVVCENPKFIFFMVPKTATISIYHGYLKINYETLNKRYNAISWGKWKKCLTFEEFKSYPKFSIVRNPWDRVVSLYSYFTQTKKLRNKWKYDVPFFDDFVENFFRYCNSRKDLKNHATPCHYYTHYKGKKFVDYIGKFENLNEDINSIFKRVGIKPTKLPVRNNSFRMKYQNYYTDRTRMLVKQYYKQDIELFGYKF